MDTRFLLMAPCDALPIIPVDQVRLDFFKHLTLPVFMRKLHDGAIALPMVKFEKSQKSQKGIHIEDLAYFLDSSHKEALKEHRRFHR